jgi:autotransporter-associated beta strand protein
MIRAALGGITFFLMGAVASYSANLTWDANGTGVGQVDGSGSWLDANQWYDGVSNVNWTSGDNATIGVGGAGGTITLGAVNASALTFNSFSGTYILTGGSLGMGTGITAAPGAAEVIIETPLIMSADAVINSSGAGSKVTVVNPLVINGGGNKILTLSGANSNGNTIQGTLTNGAGGTLQVTVSMSNNGDRWGLSGTNTYSGKSYVNKGWLYIQGRDALPTNSYVELRGVSSSKGNLALLDDGVGTITFVNEVEKFEVQTSAGGNVSFFVGNNNIANGGISSGTTTGSTIAIGPLYLNGDARVRDMYINSTSANDYRLQFNDVYSQANYNTSNWPFYFNPTSGRVFLAGTISQKSGNTIGTAHRLGLSGTTTGNMVTGVIADPADYTSGSNTSARPLGLIKNNSSTWTLVGMNTFTGPTEVSGGTLVLDGPECLSDVASLTMSGSGSLQINAGQKEKVGSLYFGATQQTNGTWGSSASRAQNKNDTYFAGDGVLYVGIDLPALGTVIILR